MNYTQELSEAEKLSKILKDCNTKELTEWTISMIIMGFLSSNNLTLTKKPAIIGNRPTE